SHIYIQDQMPDEAHGAPNTAIINGTTITYFPSYWRSREQDNNHRRHPECIWHFSIHRKWTCHHGIPD
ncbi:MAG TPA: hypothetical protein VE692_02990, partial [Nitrososphaera sp.]|nr:hypothetical protein [Nitrososphaera sp.]